MSRFQFPLQGVDKNGGDSVGDVVVSQTFPLTFADTGIARMPFKLPRPYRILSIHADTLTASDATTAVLALGVPGTPARFAAALNVKAAGRVLASSDATKLAGMTDTTNGDTIDFVATLTAAAGTTGAFEVTVMYTCPRARNE